MGTTIWNRTRRVLRRAIASAWRRAARALPLYLLLTACLLDPLACLLHCELVRVAAAAPVSLHAAGDHSAHSHHSMLHAGSAEQPRESESGRAATVGWLFHCQVHAEAVSGSETPAESPAPHTPIAAVFALLAFGAMLVRCWAKRPVVHPPRQHSPPRHFPPPKAAPARAGLLSAA